MLSQIPYELMKQFFRFLLEQFLIRPQTVLVQDAAHANNQVESQRLTLNLNTVKNCWNHAKFLEAIDKLTALQVQSLVEFSDSSSLGVENHVSDSAMDRDRDRDSQRHLSLMMRRQLHMRLAKH